MASVSVYPRTPGRPQRHPLSRFAPLYKYLYVEIPEWAEGCQRLLFPRQKRHKAKDLSRDNKIEVRTLSRVAGWTQKRIENALGYTRHQVLHALTGPLTPKKKRGHHTEVINEVGKEAIRRWLDSDDRNRQIPWADYSFCIPEIYGTGEVSVHKAMVEMGYIRHHKKQSSHTLHEYVSYAYSTANGYYVTGQTKTNGILTGPAASSPSRLSRGVTKRSFVALLLALNLSRYAKTKTQKRRLLIVVNPDIARAD